MEVSLHLIIGIMGNAASLFLYAAPILTFKRVIKKKSTEEFSCVPYIVALLNCLVYTWYGLPVVSNKWENLPLVTINGIGILLELSFIFIYLCFASPKTKKMVGLMLLQVMMAFSITAIASALALKDHRHRKMLVGIIGLVASVSMYASPLIIVRQVITKSVEFMPFNLSFFSFLACSLWMAYGLIGHDLLIAAPNIVSCPLGVLQLVLYGMYRRNKWNSTKEEPNKEIVGIEKIKPPSEEPNTDLEKNGEINKFPYQVPVKCSCVYYGN